MATYILHFSIQFLSFCTQDHDGNHRSNFAKLDKKGRRL